MANELEVVKGAKLAKRLTILDEDDAAITTYTGAATLAATVSRGDDQASLFSPAVAWISASAGTISWSITSAQSTTLTPGVYNLQLSITAGGDPVIRPIGVLRVLPAPGTGTARSVYCTRDEMLRLAGSWAEKLQRPEIDQTGFAEERADARQELERRLHSAWQRQTYTSVQTGWEDLYYPAGSAYQVGIRDVTLTTWLADDRLVVYSDIRDFCGYWALARICERQINPSKDDGYAAAAMFYADKAETTAASIVAEINPTQGDTLADDGADDAGLSLYSIRLGAVRVVKA